MTASRSNGPVLSIRNVSVALPKGGDRPLAVKGVSLDVPPGEIVCLVGESGSGKSVTAFSVMGLGALPVVGGEIGRLATGRQAASPKLDGTANGDRGPTVFIRELARDGREIRGANRQINAPPNRHDGLLRARRLVIKRDQLAAVAGNEQLAGLIELRRAVLEKTSRACSGTPDRHVLAHDRFGFRERHPEANSENVEAGLRTSGFRP